MDIAGASIAHSQAQVKQQASMAVMKKAMDTSEQQSNLMNEMLDKSGAQAIQQAAQPHKGASVDLSV
ncbi:YjfB family protein [Salibacterium halotolerans]|uniref:Putative motility protein n=1 Tax=Salibacterium halotolerans TaxID=1884432 RepID=A0A1I5VUK0_9BACI|nr:YjfB family protein [Salibacterium halotolerans]SFQ11218.1 Putative motility protein [Salibacterium halotolerans]